ncbi:Teneurin-2 [Toxocara canis]|uniref:Teneurin-2 n=1 Tax=Toxocara canis TaxID=6265 RepID=A0A0B2UYS7_TOXCA|nr:Teneurin-2 [Toxocara canis]
MIFVLLSGLHSVLCERCPIIIGDFECPVGYKCVDNQCSSPDGQLGSADCKKVNCPSMTRCFKGRCYSTTGLTCNRNVLLDSSTAESIISNCGDKGKCINGRCVEDRCMDVSCKETEICRDGVCVQMAGAFCLFHFDCGPSLECIGNRCAPTDLPIECNCDPGEFCQQGKCFPDRSCAHVVCSQGSLCTNGACAPVVGRECSQEACEGGTVCVNGHCVLDPCTNRCPADHECRLGECRHLQGISCHNQCPHPYECIDGRCTRNDCARKVCKVGEACENGLCVKVEDRFCTLAIRDCGERFECESNKCHDKLLQTV